MTKAKKKPVKRKRAAPQTAHEVDQYEDAIAKMDAFNQLVDAANSGNKAALNRIRGILWDPRGRVYLDALGDVARQAMLAVIERFAPNQEAAQIAIRQFASELRSELEGSTPSAIERLLVERVVIAWLQAAHADRAATNDKGASLKQAEFYVRRVDLAQRRLLAAIKTLATVRRLALPIRVDVDLQVSGCVESQAKREPTLPNLPVPRIPANRWQTAGANN